MFRELNHFGISDGYRPYRDTEEDSLENAQKYFHILLEIGFIIERGDEHFLDLSKVYKETNLFKILEEIRYEPPHLKKRLIDLTKTLDGLYHVSKDRKYATSISGSLRKINPIFDLAVSPILFSEDPVDYAIDGCRTLPRGTFFPIVVWASLFNKPFARNICAHGYLELEGYNGLKISDIIKTIENPVIDSDVLRYCALLPTNSLEDTQITPDTFTKGKKIIYRASNLSKHLVKHYGPQRISEEGNEDMDRMIEGMSIVDAINIFQKSVYKLSRKIEKGCKLDKADITQYLEMIKSISSVFPSTVNRIARILNG